MQSLSKQKWVISRKCIYIIKIEVHFCTGWKHESILIKETNRSSRKRPHRFRNPVQKETTWHDYYYNLVTLNHITIIHINTIYTLNHTKI